MKLNKTTCIAAACAVGLALGSCSKEAPQAYITKYKGDRQAAISFTYDDGMLCHYTEVAPELEKRGFRGTFWLIGANMGKDEPGYPWMSWQQVAELAARGHEISNHTWTHPALPGMSIDSIKREIAMCDSAIFAVTHQMPITFCYPYNAMSDEVVALATEGRVGSRTYWDAHGQAESHCTSESLTAWLDEVVESGRWAVTMTHGTTYGWDKWDDPQVLWNLYDQVKERNDSVWVGTFAEVASYVAERDATQLSTTLKGDKIEIVPTTDLDPTLYTQPLTLRIDGDFADKKYYAMQNGVLLDLANNADHLLIDFLPSAGSITLQSK